MQFVETVDRTVATVRPKAAAFGKRAKVLVKKFMAAVEAQQRRAHESARADGDRPLRSARKRLRQAIAPRFVPVRDRPKGTRIESRDEDHVTVSMPMARRIWFVLPFLFLPPALYGAILGGLFLGVVPHRQGPSGRWSEGTKKATF